MFANRKTMTIRLNTSLHKKLKFLALSRGITVQGWVMCAIVEKMYKDDMDIKKQNVINPKE